MSYAGPRTMSFLPQPPHATSLVYIHFLIRISCNSIWLMDHKSYLKLWFLVIWECSFSIYQQKNLGGMLSQPSSSVVPLFTLYHKHFKIMIGLENSPLHALFFSLPHDQWEDRQFMKSQSQNQLSTFTNYKTNHIERFIKTHGVLIALPWYNGCAIYCIQLKYTIQV